MFEVTHHILFLKKDEFIKDQLLQVLYRKGLDSSQVFTLEKKQSEKEFLENLYTKPLLGNYSVGFVEVTEDYDGDKYEKFIGQVPDHAFLVFMFDRLPSRVTAKVKNNIQFRDAFSEEENEAILNNFLTIVGKKVSVTARKFLIDRMGEDAAKTMAILSKLSALIPHLYLDETIIKNSFEEAVSNFQVPLMFFKSKGLEAVRILDKIEYAAFRPLYLNFLMNLIKFKLSENKSFSEKMRILKSSPTTIQRFVDLVKPHTIQSLEARFLYYSAAFRESKDIFLIKHLTYKQ